MNIQHLLKQAQKVQQDVQKLQEELAQRSFEGTAGGGAVTATCTGDHRFESLKISPDLIKEAANDTSLLEDLILSAVQQAIDASKETSEREMKKLTGGMGLPPGMGF